MQRPPDLNERVARIEEKVAMRDDVAELRAAFEANRRPMARWLGGAVFGAMLTAGFLALILMFTR